MYSFGPNMEWGTSLCHFTCCEGCNNTCCEDGFKMSWFMSLNVVVPIFIVQVVERGGSNCHSLCHRHTTMLWFKLQFKPWLIKYYANQQQYH